MSPDPAMTEVMLLAVTALKVTLPEPARLISRLVAVRVSLLMLPEHS